MVFYGISVIQIIVYFETYRAILSSWLPDSCWVFSGFSSYKLVWAPILFILQRWHAGFRLRFEPNRKFFGMSRTKYIHNTRNAEHRSWGAVSLDWLGRHARHRLAPWQTIGCLWLVANRHMGMAHVSLSTACFHIEGVRRQWLLMPGAQRLWWLVELGPSLKTLLKKATASMKVSVRGFIIYPPTPCLQGGARPEKGCGTTATITTTTTITRPKPPCYRGCRAMQIKTLVFFAGFKRDVWYWVGSNVCQKWVRWTSDSQK